MKWFLDKNKIYPDIVFWFRQSRSSIEGDIIIQGIQGWITEWLSESFLV